MTALILLSIAVSLDGFWGGFAYGMRKLKITLFPLTLIALCSFVGSYIAITIGATLINYLSIQVATWAGALLIIAIGCWIIKDGVQRKNTKNLCQVELPTESTSSKKQRYYPSLLQVLKNPLLADLDKSGTINMPEALILGVAVAIDASVAAFALGLAGFPPLLTAFLFGLAHFLLVGLGNVLALNKLVYKISDRFVFVPGCILIIVGILRLL